MFKKLLFLLIFLIFATPAQASSWPAEVKPEQGKASGTLGTGDEQLTVAIEFWNVGAVGGGEYGKATIDLGCIQKMIGDWKCTADENPPSVGTFSGGPNGKITLNENIIQLVNGKNFTSDLEKTFQATVENPEIFSKYNWDEEKIPQDSGENSIAELLNVYGEDIKIFPDSDQNARTTAKWGSKLVPGTHIVTGIDSVTIRFTKGSGYHLTPNSEVILISGDPKPKLRLVKGEMQVTGHDPFEIDMDEAVCDVQGTTFVVKQTSDTSILKVIDGTVLFTSKANGKTETVTAGEAISADKNGLSSKTTFDPVAENKKWQELADSLKKTNNNILTNKNMVYFTGGIFIGVAFILGFLILKSRKPKRV